MSNSHKIEYFLPQVYLSITFLKDNKQFFFISHKINENYLGLDFIFDICNTFW